MYGEQKVPRYNFKCTYRFQQKHLEILTLCKKFRINLVFIKDLNFKLNHIEYNCYQPVVHLSTIICMLTSHCSEHWVSSKAQEGHNADTSCTYQKPGCSSTQHDCDINTARSLTMSIWQDAGLDQIKLRIWTRTSVLLLWGPRIQSLCNVTSSSFKIQFTGLSAVPLLLYWPSYCVSLFLWAMSYVFLFSNCGVRNCIFGNLASKYPLTICRMLMGYELSVEV